MQTYLPLKYREILSINMCLLKEIKSLGILFSSASSFKNQHFDGVYKQDIFQNQKFFYSRLYHQYTNQRNRSNRMLLVTFFDIYSSIYFLI